MGVVRIVREMIITKGLKWDFLPQRTQRLAFYFYDVNEQNAIFRPKNLFNYIPSN